MPGTATAQAGSLVGFKVEVQGTTCSYGSSTAGALRRRLQAGTSSKLTQVIAGIDTSGDPLVTEEEAQVLATIIKDATESDTAKAKLLADAVKVEGYDAKAGAERMTAEVDAVRAVSTLPSLPPHTNLAPRCFAFLAAAVLEFEDTCPPAAWAEQA